MNAREKLAAAGTLVLALPAMLASWWFVTQGNDPWPVLVVLPALLLLACVILTWVGRRLRWAALVAPLALATTCLGGFVASSRFARSHVVAFCQRMLASPSATPVFRDALAALAQRPRAECRVHDLTWGSWELGVYSGETVVGYLDVSASGDDEGFRIDNVSLSPTSR